MPDQDERRGHVVVRADRIPVSAEVARLECARPVLFVCPVWHFGFLTMLKVCLDRIHVLRLVFHLTGRWVALAMRRVRARMSITTCGPPRSSAIFAGDAASHITRRVLRVVIHSGRQAVQLARRPITASTQAPRAACVARLHRVAHRR